MYRMHPPKVPGVAVAVPSTDDLQRLLAVCGTNDFEGRRDTAIIRLFLDAGLRLSELTNLTLDDVDLPGRSVGVVGKGDRYRLASFGVKTAKAIDRYLRVRRGHASAELAALWLGLRGPMTTSGVRLMLWRRSTEADIPRLHPHQLRHYFAHRSALRASRSAPRRRWAGSPSAHTSTGRTPRPDDRNDRTYSIPIGELAAEMGVPQDVALTLARRAGATTFGRSWRGEQMVPSRIAEKTLAAGRDEAADRRRLEHVAEHRAWEIARAAERQRVFDAETRKFSLAERLGESGRHTFLAYTGVGTSAISLSGRAATVASQRAAAHMQDWLKRHPEPVL